MRWSNRKNAGLNIHAVLLFQAEQGWCKGRAGIRSGTLGRPSNLALVTLTFTSTVACALFWEFAEFLSDRYFGTNSQVGLEDTLLDMLLGVVGGAVFVGIAWFRQGGSDQSTPGRDHA